MNKQVTIALITAFILGVGGVGYSWADWVTKTLIAVDKRTEVMASQISFIKEHMERNYGNVEGANLLDWPITLAELEPYYAKAEDKMGVTRTNGIPGLPGNNNYKVFEAGAKALGYKQVHTGRMAINSEFRDDRNACQQTGFCF